jgi:hypothetical protein
MQTDEGYSEDPLNTTAPSSFAVKSRDNSAASLGGSQPHTELPEWLIRNMSAMSLSSKARMSINLAHFYLSLQGVGVCPFLYHTVLAAGSLIMVFESVLISLAQ